MTFLRVINQFTATLCVQLRVETKMASLVQLNPADQALIGQILTLNQDGLKSRQIADYLNELGVTYWRGKRLYPQLVFGVLRKAAPKVACSLGVLSPSTNASHCQSIKFVAGNLKTSARQA